MDYNSLLSRAYEKMPNTALTKMDRFEIPKAAGHIQGNKTIISNFSQISSTLGGKPQQVLKFILKELATPGEIKGQYLILGSKIPASRINEKVRKYAIEYLICAECGKPDTKILKEGNIHYKKCMACGAKEAIKKMV